MTASWRFEYLHTVTHKLHTTVVRVLPLRFRVRSIRSSNCTHSVLTVLQCTRYRYSSPSSVVQSSQKKDSDVLLLFSSFHQHVPMFRSILSHLRQAWVHTARPHWPWRASRVIPTIRSIKIEHSPFHTYYSTTYYVLSIKMSLLSRRRTACWISSTQSTWKSMISGSQSLSREWWATATACDKLVSAAADGWHRASPHGCYRDDIAVSVCKLRKPSNCPYRFESIAKATLPCYILNSWTEWAL